MAKKKEEVRYVISQENMANVMPDYYYEEDDDEIENNRYEQAQLLPRTYTREELNKELLARSGYNGLKNVQIFEVARYVPIEISFGV